MKFFTFVTMVMVSVFTTACDSGHSSSNPQAPENDKQEITQPISVSDAEAIFDYAYPLVIMKISQDLMQTVPIRPRTTPNHFIHFRRLAQPEQRAVVLGNRNTLYSVGWLDLSKGPVVFTIPDMGDRYYVMPLLDAWTNTFESLGSRTTGQGTQNYLISGPGFEGETPDGFTQIVSPTNMVWITGRIQADSAEDAQQVVALQDQFKLMTYTEHLGGSDPFQNFQPQFTFAKVGLPVPYSLRMEAEEFYDTFLSLWRMNQSPDEDRELVKLMARAGLVLEELEKFSDLDPNVQSVLEAGLKSKQAAYSKAFYEGTSQTEDWLFNTDPTMGNWGIEFGRRAYWAMWGLGTNISQDAVYGVTQLDSELRALNGQNTYRIRFEPGELPPTNAFWSVTSYDVEGYLERNSVDRYSLGSNHQLNFNEDGSLELLLTHSKPTDENLNWVPVPEEEFKILLRIYWPKREVLEGSWSLPDVELVSE